MESKSLPPRATALAPPIPPMAQVGKPETLQVSIGRQNPLFAKGPGRMATHGICLNCQAIIKIRFIL